MHCKKLLDSEIGKAFGVLGDHGNGFFGGVANKVFSGFCTVDKDLSFGDGVTLCKDFNVVDECGFSRTGRTDNGDGIPRTDGDLGKVLGLSRTGGTGKYCKGLYGG